MRRKFERNEEKNEQKQQIEWNTQSSKDKEMKRKAERKK